jgi:hypothetical protein
MNTFKSIIVLGLIAALPLYAGAATATPENQTKSTAQSTRSMPVYKPPLRGAPAGRIGGGTRGTTERESFSLQVLAPDHVGYTTKEQPCLYWYISKPTIYSVELTITERHAVKPLVEQIIKSPEKSGIQSLCLADYGVKLRSNVEYKWFVTIVPDAEHRSRDIMAGGILSFIDPQPPLLEKLREADSGSAPSIYAEEGFWYDAVEALSKMIDASPRDENLRRQRASLLEQVGLAEAAGSENGQQPSPQ